MFSTQTMMFSYENVEVDLKDEQFGLITDNTTGKTTPVWRYTWKNSNNVTVQVISYGATITSIKVPDKNQKCEDVVMGYDTLEEYFDKNNPYFGATLGRSANRIGKAQFTINGDVYKVTPNLGKHQLHGGLKGFDKVNWNHSVDGTKVIMTYLSKDGEEGYPGDVLATVTFELTSENIFNVNLQAVSTKPTFVNMANHSYFNLAGHGAGSAELYKHVVTINADKITETDKNSIPTGKLLPVSDTVFDLRVPKQLGTVINKVPSTGGFDQNFCVTKSSQQVDQFVASLKHPGTWRVLEVYSNQPGVQFYTSNGISKGTIVGKGGVQYEKHGAFCLETQNYPDAINHPNFPKAVLNPGETYCHNVAYKFLLER